MMGAIMDMMGSGAPTVLTLIGQLLQQQQPYKLSPDQVKQLQTLQTEAQKAGLRNTAEVRIAELDLDALLREDPIDLAKVEDTIKALESLRSSGRSSYARTLVRAKALLTPEQVKKVQEGQTTAMDHGGSPVQQQPEKQATTEHPSGTAEAFTAEQIKAAMRQYITAKTTDGGGIFKMHDDKTGQDLALEFVKIHDPVRKIEGKGYFACTDFRVQGEPQKVYDLDFWLDPQDNKLVVTRTTIHKEPRQVGNGWVKVPRYTFENDQPVELR
jgi:Spy/CpxP family protein refolding chaperone